MTQIRCIRAGLNHRRLEHTMHIHSIVMMIALALVFCAIELAGAPAANLATTVARWAPALVAIGMAAALIVAERHRRLAPHMEEPKGASPRPDRQTAGQDPAASRRAEAIAIAPTE